MDFTTIVAIIFVIAVFGSLTVYSIAVDRLNKKEHHDRTEKS